MKIKFATLCIVIGTVFAPVAVHAADQDSGSKQTMTVAKDPALATKIRARLAEEKFSSLPDITIDADANGAVVMTGKVKSEQEADNIIFIVHRVEGVKAVKSNFRLTSDK
jgi:osmotically-inducible protein OsmY